MKWGFKFHRIFFSEWNLFRQNTTPFSRGLHESSAGEHKPERYMKEGTYDQNLNQLSAIGWIGTRQLIVIQKPSRVPL